MPLSQYVVGNQGRDKRGAWRKQRTQVFGGIGIWQNLGEFQHFQMRCEGEGSGKPCINLNIFS